MYLSLEFLILFYFLLSLLGLSAINFLKLGKLNIAPVYLLIINTILMLTYYYYRPASNYFALLDRSALFIIAAIITINSLLPFFDRSEKRINPAYYVMLNIFSLLALKGLNLHLIAMGIIGIRFCDLSIATGQANQRDVSSLFKQYFHLLLVVLCLGTSLIFNIFSGEFNLGIAQAFCVAALILDTGLLNLRMIRRYDITNRQPAVIFIKYLSINQVVLISFLFYLNRTFSPIVHWLLLAVMMVTCLVQLVGFTQSRSVYHYMPRIYLINVSLVILLYSFCRDQAMLTSIIYFSFAIHLIQPLIISLFELNENRQWNFVSKLTLILAVGWITLLPLPSSFFARLSLMLMNSGSYNWSFYLLYLLCLVVATGSLLQRGMRYYQSEVLRDKPIKIPQAYIYFAIMLMLIIGEVFLAVRL